MPTIEQIRAARALLDWSQNDLAEEAGLSQTGIARIENGTNKPNSSTLAKIEAAFDRADVEFISDTGVKKRTGELHLLKGKEGFKQFRQEVLSEAKENKRADICISNLDERLFDKWGSGEINDRYRNAMAKLRTENSFLKFRSLIKEGDTHFSAARHSEYKWMRPEDFGYFPFYIYGKKTAMVMFEENDINIFILNHPLITKFYREQFEKMWAAAKNLNINPLERLSEE
jgi:transcriptional regulator with XRE-family HTH domain